MALTPLSTLLENLVDALDYEESGSVAKAKSVVTYAKQLLVRRPSSGGHGGSNQAFDTPALERMITEARLWLRNNDTTNSANNSQVTYLSVGRFRG